MAELTEILSKKLELASSPHVHSKWSTRYAMMSVIIALVPAVISAVVVFGPYQLVIIAVSIFFAVLTEFVIKKMRKQDISIKDSSAILTGLLLALILPPNYSLVMTALGSIVAIAVGKEVFGGLGFNIFNPALVGRAFLQAAYPVPMTTWVKPNFAVDGVTSATPLASYKFDGVATDLMPMFLGNTGGCLGETSVIALLLGGIVLVAMKIVNWRVPVSMLIGALIFGGIFWLVDPASYANPIYHIFAGGFMFGAFYMASDWVTSPLTNKGLWIFGFGIAFVIIIIRLFGGLPEGVMYAILFMNTFVPLINKYTVPKLFGEKK